MNSLFEIQGDQGLVQASEERNSLTRVLHFAEYDKENTPSVEISNLNIPNVRMYDVRIKTHNWIAWITPFQI